MENRNLGAEIREFLRGLFGSRLNAHLEIELMQVRADYETRLLERQQTISDLKEQCAQLTSKVERYELVIIPLASPFGGFFAPKKERPPLEQVEPVEMPWAEVKADWDNKQDAMEEETKPS